MNATMVASGNESSTASGFIHSGHSASENPNAPLTRNTGGYSSHGSSCKQCHYSPKQSKPTPTPQVKAPFLIETREWDSPTFEWLVNAGYIVSGLVLLRFNGKLRTCWVWALKGRGRASWEAAKRSMSCRVRLMR